MTNLKSEVPVEQGFETMKKATLRITSFLLNRPDLHPITCDLCNYVGTKKSFDFGYVRECLGETEIIKRLRCPKCFNFID